MFKISFKTWRTGKKRWSRWMVAHLRGSSSCRLSNQKYKSKWTIKIYFSINYEMLKTNHNHNVIKDKVRNFHSCIRWMSWWISRWIFHLELKFWTFLMCPFNGLFKNFMNIFFWSLGSWEIDETQSGNSFLRHPVVKKCAKF